MRFAVLASRSLTSLMIAAAVSSIERRVTSITGQPLSANMRRAKASFGIDRFAVDIVGLRRLVEREQAVAADLDQPLGAGGQADDQRMLAALNSAGGGGDFGTSGMLATL